MNWDRQHAIQLWSNNSGGISCQHTGSFPMQGLFRPDLVGQEMSKAFPSLEGIYLSFPGQYTCKCTKKLSP